MKKSILMLMVVGLLAAMPVLAAENAKSDPCKECVIRCAMQSEDIVQKIKRLQNEVKKGNTTYSAEELRKLEKQLKDANEMLDSLTRK